MYVQIVELLGNVQVTENNIGKAILFNLLVEEYSFDCILYVGKHLEPFVVLHDDDFKYKPEIVLQNILQKYKIEELIEIEEL